MNTLSGSAWLTIERRKRGYMSDLRIERVTAGKPTCGPNQVAVKLEIELPAGLFTEPTITARLKIDGDAAPQEISMETLAGVDAALTSAGFAVRVVADVEKAP